MSCRRWPTAMEQIAATVKTNAEGSLEANSLAESTRGQAERGREVVAETVVAMANIRESATEIGDIVATIEAIAFQTNLLALNAAVEAARAGRLLLPAHRVADRPDDAHRLDPGHPRDGLGTAPRGEPDREPCSRRAGGFGRGSRQARKGSPGVQSEQTCVFTQVVQGR